MTTANPPAKHEKRISTGRRLRETYESLGRGEIATLRRCATADEMLVEGEFWRLCKSAGVDRSFDRVAILVTLFPSCEAQVGEFRLGRFLADVTQKPGKRAGKATPLAFRQLLAARDANELTRRLRRILTAANRRIDWGVVYADIHEWMGGDDGRQRICRRWLQDFYHDDNGPSDDGR